MEVISGTGAADWAALLFFFRFDLSILAVDDRMLNSSSIVYCGFVWVFDERM